MHEAVRELILIGGTALLYAPEVNEAQRQAAFDSILYAQLLANKKVGSRFADPEGWHAAYRHVYRELGWLKLASTHDQKFLGKTRQATRTQPLEAWLRMRSIQHEAVLAQVTSSLSRSDPGFRHLLKFAAQDDVEHSTVVVEIGLLKAGPTLDLCSIALQTSSRLCGTSLQALLSDHVLHGEAVFNGFSLVLDNARFDRQRAQLQALMADKDQQGAYRFDLREPTTGDDHE